jgi:pyridoxamine 5'-phosphate oxidase
MAIKDSRREYKFATMRRSSMRDDPIDQFRMWLDAALAADLPDPTAMCLATVDNSGRPSQRMVLLKDFGDDGFVFFTNLKSRKASEIICNNSVCLHFSWLSLERQVIIRGKAELLSREKVDNYFRGRPRTSQIGAWTSRQSKVITNRAVLEERYARIEKQFAQFEIPTPEFWGGYIVSLERVEFWQGGEQRLHDRFCYTLDRMNETNSKWKIERLAP